MAVSYTLTQTSTIAATTASAGAVTFSSVAIGTAATDRLVAVMGVVSGGTNPTPTSITIGGITAQFATMATASRTFIAWALVPTGTTATVVVNTTSSGGATGGDLFYAWSVTGADQSFATMVATSTSPFTIAGDAGGVILAGAWTFDSPSYTGLTTDDTQATLPSGFKAAGSYSLTADESAHSVTVNTASLLGVAAIAFRVNPVVQKATGRGTAATTTMTLPAAPTAGNLLLMRVASDAYMGSAPAGFTIPAGCSQQTFHGAVMAYKVADGSEKSVSYTIGSATFSDWIYEELQGIDTTTPVDKSAGTFTQASGNTQATPSITPTAGRKLIATMMGGSAGSATSGLSVSWSNGFFADGAIGQTSGSSDWVGAGYRSVTADGATAYTTTGTASPNSPTLQSRSGLVIAFNRASVSGGTNGTASGSTVSVTASVVSGSASGTRNPTVAGATLSVTASLITGGASGTINQTVAGQMLSAAASLTAGTVTGAATASGQTLTATVSAIGGAAAGTATATGATATASASVIPGTASGDAAVPGQTLTAAASLLSGAASAGTSATAPGATVAASGSLLAGSVQTGGTAAGQTLPLGASLLAGTATGNAVAGGQTVSASATLTPGAAAGGNASTALGATLVAAVSLIPGTASGTQTATASGTTLTATASLLPGGAAGESSVSATAPGDTVAAATTIVAGTATGATNATAPGAILTAAATLVPGFALGVWNAATGGGMLTATVSILPGTAAGTFFTAPSPDPVHVTGRQRQTSLIGHAQGADLSGSDHRVTLTGQPHDVVLTGRARAPKLT